MDWQALLLNDRVVASLVTALVGGGVVAAGWFWTHALSRRRDKLLRNERIDDIQRALLAEIRAHVVALERQSDAGGLEARPLISDEDYLPILPHDANDRIFRAIVEEVHMLPEWAIDPVVRYYRLLAVRAALAQDIRSNAKDYPRRAAEMFRDYVLLNEETLETGLDAMEILTASVKGGRREVEAALARRRREIEGDLTVAVNTRSSDPRGQ
ncbi:hypothetical protein [Paracoccus zhejiangensis]|uniref:Uncharacterized protein n=1 Tax=Paracoccus zhejiangensis TaxID=1077935 RepID=A0A2H5EV51_9RHOB|nr:hypothetical protein [Paracoccus zhejiangensis]AUH63178.1 hypothetical protein CX676_02570 [Paracoccus zhejiangensis]